MLARHKPCTTEVYRARQLHEQRYEKNIRGYVTLYKCVFFHIVIFLLPAEGLFSRSRHRGTQEGRPYYRRKFGSRAGTVTRALRVQSRKVWHVIAGSVCAEIEPSKTMADPHVRCFVPLR